MDHWYDVQWRLWVYFSKESIKEVSYKAMTRLCRVLRRHTIQIIFVLSFLSLSKLNTNTAKNYWTQLFPPFSFFVFRFNNLFSKFKKIFFSGLINIIQIVIFKYHLLKSKSAKRFFFLFSFFFFCTFYFYFLNNWVSFSICILSFSSLKNTRTAIVLASFLLSLLTQLSYIISMP